MAIFVTVILFSVANIVHFGTNLTNPICTLGLKKENQGKSIQDKAV